MREGGGRSHDAASCGGINAREGRTRGGRQASFTLSAVVPQDGQGTELNRSFRKLSGSVISDNRPRKEAEVAQEQECKPPAH